MTTCPDLYSIQCDVPLPKDYDGYYCSAVNDPCRTNSGMNSGVDFDFVGSGFPRGTTQEHNSRFHVYYLTEILSWSYQLS